MVLPVLLLAQPAQSWTCKQKIPPCSQILWARNSNLAKQRTLCCPHDDWRLSWEDLIDWVWLEHLRVGQLALRISFHGGFTTQVSGSWAWGQAVDQNTHMWSLHIAWGFLTKWRLCSPKVCIERKQSESNLTRIIRGELNGLFWSSLRVTQHHFYFVPLSYK